jgi:aminoglycoside phosphotransferase (APT) family kinase protein
MSSTEASYPRHNWLPAAIPSDARRFRVADPKLGETLVASGAELVRAEPDVELGTAETIGTDAPYVVVSIEHITPEGGSRLMRAARRATRSLTIRVSAERARRTLRARSYAMSSVILWEWEQAVRLPWVRASPRSSWNARFPLAALVIGTRRGRCPTILDTSLAQAGEQIGVRLDYGWPIATQAGLVSIAERGVLRVALGGARRHLRYQRDALTALEAAAPPKIAPLIPAHLGDGTAGLATWSLEQRVPGAPAPSTLPPDLLDECIDFLVALARLGDNSKQTSSPVADAELIANSQGGEHVAMLGALGSHLERALAAVPRVFAHGDFWSGNLLIEEGRLSGVVDWDHGGAGRLPLLDLLQLRLNMIRATTHQFLGPALVEHLLPWASAGGDEQSRGYASRLGIEVSASRLEAFVIAYWLDRVAHELGSYADRTERPVWMRQNVDFVLEAIRQAGIMDRLRASAAA